jgi:hypothetical protein
MKTITQRILGWGSALVLVTGLTSSAIAGPGPQFWQQQEQLRAENAARAKDAAATAKPADASAMACVSCKTDAVREYRSSQAGGKVAARFDTVGSKHACSACGGALTTVRGNTTNDMTSNCPICAKAKTASAACCTATS